MATFLSPKGSRQRIRLRLASTPIFPPIEILFVPYNVPLTIPFYSDGCRLVGKVTVVILSKILGDDLIMCTGIAYCVDGSWLETKTRQRWEAVCSRRANADGIVSWMEMLWSLHM